MTPIHSSNEEILLHQMVETIVREVAPEAIILFGSRARGDARPDSDVDLLVVETEPFSPQRSRRKEAARLYMALRGTSLSTVSFLASVCFGSTGRFLLLFFPPGISPNHFSESFFTLSISTLPATTMMALAGQ